MKFPAAPRRKPHKPEHSTAVKNADIGSGNASRGYVLAIYLGCGIHSIKIGQHFSYFCAFVMMNSLITN